MFHASLPASVVGVGGADMAAALVCTAEVPQRRERQHFVSTTKSRCENKNEIFLGGGRREEEKNLSHKKLIGKREKTRRVEKAAAVSQRSFLFDCFPRAARCTRALSRAAAEDLPRRPEVEVSRPQRFVPWVFRSCRFFFFFERPFLVSCFQTAPVTLSRSPRFSFQGMQHYVFYFHDKETER